MIGVLFQDFVCLVRELGLEGELEYKPTGASVGPNTN